MCQSMTYIIKAKRRNKMFKLELADNQIFKNIFESVSSIVDEITLIADNDGLHLRSLDKSHITFITLELNKTLFDEYECDIPEKMAIDCDDFYKLLKKCNRNDILELSKDESNLLITFAGDAKRKFKLPFIDMEYDNPVPPRIDLPCKISIPSNLLKDYISDMGFFSDKLDFIIDENYFKVKTVGQKGEAETEYLHGENILEVVRSGYSIPKLQEIMKAHKFSEECNVYLGNDMPLKINFTLITGDGSLEYLLAPRLEDDG